MCKIIIATAHSAKNLKQTIATAWTYFNQTGENDGFGAVWLDRAGKLCWLKSSTPNIGQKPPRFCFGFADDQNGDSPSNGGFLLIHGRKATCGKSLENTHPMLDGAGSALIHNGIVRSSTIKNENSTCDSELLIRAMQANDEKRLAEITGYFAFGMIQPSDSGWLLHIAKDDTARLVAGPNKSGGFTFGTTPEACQIGGAEVSHTVKSQTLLTFTGKMKHTTRKIPKAAAEPTPTRTWLDADKFNNWPMRHGSIPAAQQHLFADELAAEQEAMQ